MRAGNNAVKDVPYGGLHQVSAMLTNVCLSGSKDRCSVSSTSLRYLS